MHQLACLHCMRKQSAAAEQQGLSLAPAQLMFSHPPLCLCCSVKNHWHASLKVHVDQGTLNNRWAVAFAANGV